MRHPKAPSQKNSGLTSRKNQAKKGGKPSPLLLEESEAIILSEIFDGIDHLSIIEALNELHLIDVLLEGNPALETARQHIRQVGLSYSLLHRLCAQDGDSIARRQAGGGYQENEKTAIYALWEKLIQPRLRWKTGRFRHMLDAFATDLHIAADLLKHNPLIRREVGVMRDLARDIDAMEVWVEKIWKIANPPVPKRQARTEVGGVASPAAARSGVEKVPAGSCQFFGVDAAGDPSRA